MTRTYMKDSNGKFKLVDRDQKVAKDQKTLTENQAFTLEELAARVKRLEQIMIDPRK